VLGLSTNICSRAFGLAAILDPIVIFIIILNLHDSSLSESGCNIGPKSLGCNVVLWKCDN